jgi:hypothetical protein
MFERITGQVQKTLLESDEEVGHIRCPKLEYPVCKTDRRDDIEGT